MREPWKFREEYDEVVEPLDPACECGSLMFWWNSYGDQRCMECDPPKGGAKLREKAARLREAAK